jgi:hypothetical protein
MNDELVNISQRRAILGMAVVDVGITEGVPADLIFADANRKNGDNLTEDVVELPFGDGGIQISCAGMCTSPSSYAYTWWRLLQIRMRAELQSSRRFNFTCSLLLGVWLHFPSTSQMFIDSFHQRHSVRNHTQSQIDDICSLHGSSSICKSRAIYRSQAE